MDIKELLNKRVSFQTATWTPLSKEMSIQDVLEEIKSNKYSYHINRLRTFIKNNENEQYNINKKKLPSVTFCGTFNTKRKKEFLKEYNQIIVIDIDKLESSEFQRVKSVLENDKYVFAFWDSPSKKGIKGLVSLSYKFDITNQSITEYHKEAFNKLRKYFLDTYKIELDESGSDTTRLCFLSCDPNLCLKSGSISFVIDEIEITEQTTKGKTKAHKLIKTGSRLDALYNPKNKNKPNDRKTIQSIIKYLTKRNLSITSTYEEWYRVAYAISNSFTYDIGEKYFIALCKIDGENYNEIDCKNILIYSYENSTGEINFDTIIYFANKKGYQTKNQRGAVPKAANEN